MKDIDFLELRNGASFNDFFKRTKKDWNNLAYKVLSSVEHPTWIDVEDITQFMAIKCIEAVKAWDPEKSTSIKSYVVFICMEYARHELHHFRGSKGADRSGPPRYDLPFSFFEDTVDALNKCPASKMSVPAQQERTVDIKRLLSSKTNFDVVAALTKGQNVGKLIQSKKHMTKAKYINNLYNQVCSI